MDPSLSMLCSHLHVMILRVNSDFPGLSLVPILHLGMAQLSNLARQQKFISNLEESHSLLQHGLNQKVLLYKISPSSVTLNHPQL